MIPRFCAEKPWTDHKIQRVHVLRTRKIAAHEETSRALPNVSSPLQVESMVFVHTGMTHRPKYFAKECRHRSKAVVRQLEGH